MISKGVALRVPFSMYDDTDGSPDTSATVPTCWVSKDGGAFVVCGAAPARVLSPTGTATNKWQILLSATEMNADCVEFTVSRAGNEDVTLTIRTESVWTAALAARFLTAKIEVIGPNVEGTNFAVIQGDDYALADGRALVWIEEDDSWPDLTSAEAVLTIGEDEYELAIDTMDGAWTLTLELTAVQTAALAAEAHKYWITMTLLSGGIITPITGLITAYGK